MARVTLAIIARHTGLSKFAVSRALSGKDGVSEETRRRVQEAAASLGYLRPVAQAVSPLLRVIFHDMDLINSELHVLMQTGILGAAQQLGYRIGMRWTHLPEEIEANARECEGLVLVGPHTREALAGVYGIGKPVVRLGWLDPLEPVDQVTGTDHEAGAAVAQFLVDLGHRTIAYVHGTPGYRGRFERLYGVREVLEREEGVAFRDMRFPTDMRFTESLMALNRDGFRPTAFFCAHDGLAVTVTSELLRLGYRIPEDATVIGFGDYSSATQVSPQLTTVKVHGTEMGAASVRLLDDRIKGRGDPARAVRIQIASTLIVRDSSGRALVRP